MLGQKNREGGFTLIEIMIVVAILGIGSAIAVPAYVRWNGQYQIRQAASELQSNLVQSRMVARNRNAVVTATFMKEIDGSYRATFGGISPPMNLPNVVGGSIISVTALGPPPTTVVTDFASTVPGTILGTITFNQQGLRVTGGVGNQAVTLTSAHGTTFSVVVAPSGKINWCKNSMITCP